MLNPPNRKTFVSRLSPDDTKEMVRRRHDLDHQLDLCRRLMAEGTFLPYCFRRATALLQKDGRHDEVIMLCDYAEEWARQAEEDHKEGEAKIWLTPVIDDLRARRAAALAGQKRRK